jgi:hypothetical protein
VRRPSPFSSNRSKTVYIGGVDTSPWAGPQPFEAEDELTVEVGYFAVKDERRCIQRRDGVHQFAEAPRVIETVSAPY